MSDLDHYSVSVIISGALDEEFTITDDGNLDDHLDTLESNIRSATCEPYEIFVVYHPHGENDECGCVEYLTDHSPIRIRVEGTE